MTSVLTVCLLLSFYLGWFLYLRHCPRNTDQNVLIESLRKQISKSAAEVESLTNLQGKLLNQGSQIVALVVCDCGYRERMRRDRHSSFDGLACPNCEKDMMDLGPGPK